MKTSSRAEGYIQGAGTMSGATPEPPGRLSAGSKQFRIPQVPIEWLDASSWRLPSGKALAEFALQAGFLAPLLFKSESFARPTTPTVRAKVKPIQKEGQR